ncbi:hypothetical protein AVEN_168272-1 [Araneus ventricosus]|uniref:Uncharacterized protein n=1 Tax=Araneus ventricosus TaxID=182803 RepID=A0A4Y2FW09_ARAVE|nr:hypothetical protein AVEN_168272-1 [Araneus ventricosus]
MNIGEDHIGVYLVIFNRGDDEDDASGPSFYTSIPLETGHNGLVAKHSPRRLGSEVSRPNFMEEPSCMTCCTLNLLKVKHHPLVWSGRI